MKRILALILVLSVPASHARDITGKTLFDWCTSSNFVPETTCKVYISGFVAGFGMGAVKDSQFLCLPPKMTGEEATDVFVRKLRGFQEQAGDKNPFFTGEMGTSLAAALALQYPCEKSK